MIVSILNQKGGVGKTTLSINLARFFTLEIGSTILVDSDRQGSARDWHAVSEGELLSVIGLDRPTLDRDIEKIRYNYDWIFIDGARDLTSMAMSAIKCSNIILIPISPAGLDMWATEDLLELIKERISWSGGKLKAAFVISKHLPNTKIGKEIRETLSSYLKSHGISTFESVNCNRIIYNTSITTGSTVLDRTEHLARAAKEEIISIAKELRDFAQ